MFNFMTIGSFKRRDSHQVLLYTYNKQKKKIEREKKINILYVKNVRNVVMLKICQYENSPYA